MRDVFYDFFGFFRKFHDFFTIMISKTWDCSLHLKICKLYRVLKQNKIVKKSEKFKTNKKTLVIANFSQKIHFFWTSFWCLNKCGICVFRYTVFVHEIIAHFDAHFEKFFVKPISRRNICFICWFSQDLRNYLIDYFCWKLNFRYSNPDQGWRVWTFLQNHTPNPWREIVGVFLDPNSWY